MCSAHEKSPDEIQIELGGDYLPWGEVRVRAVVAPECGYGSGDGDIAILVLSRHLIGMPISAARIEAPPEKADDIYIFGFGRCALSGDAIHRAVRDAGKIERVYDGHFRAPASICPGDSGGPVYSSRGDLIGVVSASVMDGDDHTQDTSLFTRLDVWSQLFSAAHEISLGASPSELPPFGDCPKAAPFPKAAPIRRHAGCPRLLLGSREPLIPSPDHGQALARSRVESQFAVLQDVLFYVNGAIHAQGERQGIGGAGIDANGVSPLRSSQMTAKKVSSRNSVTTTFCTVVRGLPADS